MAYADKMNRKDREIYVVMSDGELMEGSVWEALMVAPSFGITRIVAMVDLNDFQSLGQTSRILPNFYPMLDKVRAFGWESAEVNGHDPKSIFEAVRQRTKTRPMVLLGKTTKGKGVTYMENVPVWHYRSPNAEEYKQAVQQIEVALVTARDRVLFTRHENFRCGDGNRAAGRDAGSYLSTLWGAAGP